jgi:hypothetical protein
MGAAATGATTAAGAGATLAGSGANEEVALKKAREALENALARVRGAAAAAVWSRRASPAAVAAAAERDKRMVLDDEFDAGAGEEMDDRSPPSPGSPASSIASGKGRLDFPHNFTMIGDGDDKEGDDDGTDDVRERQHQMRGEQRREARMSQHVRQRILDGALLDGMEEVAERRAASRRSSMDPGPAGGPGAGAARRSRAARVSLKYSATADAELTRAEENEVLRNLLGAGPDPPTPRRVNFYADVPVTATDRSSGYNCGGGGGFASGFSSGATTPRRNMFSSGAATPRQNLDALQSVTANRQPSFMLAGRQPSFTATWMTASRQASVTASGRHNMHDEVGCCSFTPGCPRWVPAHESNM